MTKARTPSPDAPNRLKAMLTPLDGQLLDALRAIDQGAARIALVVDEAGHLVGLLTDGDVRRAILAGASLQAPLAPYVRHDFTSVPPDTGRASVLELMQARWIDQVPILDAERRVIGLHTLHDVVGDQERPNWAVIMAGGLGTRLRPVTETVPKPMLKVAGRPILERILLQLIGHGFRRVFIAINYLGEQIKTHFGDGKQFGCQIEYLEESTPLGTAGALALLPQQPSNPLLVMNGDLVTQADLGGLIDCHEQTGFAATVGVRRYYHRVPFGCVDVDGARIVAIEEKPQLSRLVNTGIYALDPATLRHLPAGTAVGMPELIEHCLRAGDAVGSFEIDEDWLDVGQADQLKAAREGIG